MYLIRVDDYRLEEFIHELSPPYAILSHKWEAEEVSFQDMSDIRKAHNKKGFRKIRKTCQQAASDGLRYAWIDTCCIDKKSSAELSEAINSMFNWYAKAKICYVYLSDVRCSPLNESEFAASTWFTRGWTLQELIAPKHLIFYNFYWKPIGDKEHLPTLLHEITGIKQSVLTGVVNDLSQVRISERMSWAAKRSTTRREDEAYCLMGIFDINMPLLYGEGSKAFLRLQEEIIKHSTDLSILIWQNTELGLSGLLASSVSYFSDTSCSAEAPDTGLFSQNLLMTPSGLSLKFDVRPWRLGIYIAFLTDGNTISDCDVPCWINSHCSGPIFLCEVVKGWERVWRRFNGIDMTRNLSWRGADSISFTPHVGDIIPQYREIVVPQFPGEDDDQIFTYVHGIKLHKVLSTKNRFSLDLPPSFRILELPNKVIPMKVRYLYNIDVKFGTCGAVCIIDTCDSVPLVRFIVVGIDYQGMPFLSGTTNQGDYFKDLMIDPQYSPGHSLDNLFKDTALVNAGSQTTSEWASPELENSKTDQIWVCMPNEKGIWPLSNMIRRHVTLTTGHKNSRRKDLMHVTMDRIPELAFEVHINIELCNQSLGFT